MSNIDQVQLPDGSQYNLKDNISGYVTAGYVADVIDGLTKADVGLGNVDNTSDLTKPVSTAQQTALNGKTDTTVIAPTEATTTASRRYEIGEQFILNGVLYTATAVIASGDSIIVDTNCELSESITEQIKEVDAKTQHGIVELWKNPDISTAFAGQPISVDYDVNIYDGVILTIESISSEARGAEWYEFDNDIISSFTAKSFLAVESGVNPPRVVHYGRSITGMSISGGKLTITFSDGTLTTNNFSTNASSTSTNNGLQVPVRILGLIHNN